MDTTFKTRMRKFRNAARALDRELARKDEVVELAMRLKKIEKNMKRLEKKVGLAR